MIFQAICATLVLLVPISSGYNILFMGPFPAPSHWLWLDNFARELLNRGHHVTAVTNHRTKYPHPNFTEIIIEPMFDIPYYFPKAQIFEMRFNSDFQNLMMWWTVGLQTSEYALNDPKVRKLIERNDLKFDCFILEQFFHESFLMFAHKFKTPIITIGTMGYADNMDYAMGLLTPWSSVPHLLLPYKDDMTFMQRVYNTFLSIYDLTLRKWYYIPKMQEMAEKHFSKHISGPLPDVSELEKSISLMLINSHRSTDLPRPGMPGLVNVGGVHIKTPKPLPTDLQSFLDNSKHGVIYFSLGSYMKSTEMPIEKRAILLEAFGKLKQNVLWKYEDESLENLPKNVMIKKWMPQNDILAHKNVVLFISHSGIFGTQEAIHWGVPLLCMPLYGDQHRNTIKSVRDGYALAIDFKQMTVEELESKINELLTNKKYTERVKKLSTLFKDNPIHPLDDAMFWIEYVIRHKGADHLKSYSVNLPWYKYFLLDVLLFYTLIIAGVFYIIFKILKFILKILLTNGKHKEMKENKRD